MGIAVARNGKPIADPILQWPLPDGWSLEDGATVPVAYCQVRSEYKQCQRLHCIYYLLCSTFHCQAQRVEAQGS